MRQTLTFLAVLVLVLAGLAIAQTPVGIYGYDWAARKLRATFTRAT